MSSVPVIKAGSVSPEMSALVDQMLEYKSPFHLATEMGEAVDEVINYPRTTVELLSKMSKTLPTAGQNVTNFWQDVGRLFDRV